MSDSALALPDFVGGVTDQPLGGPFVYVTPQHLQTRASGSDSMTQRFCPGGWRVSFPTLSLKSLTGALSAV